LKAEAYVVVGGGGGVVSVVFKSALFW